MLLRIHRIVLLLIIAGLHTGCSILIKAVKEGGPGLYDYRSFSCDVIAPAEKASALPMANSTFTLPDPENWVVNRGVFGKTGKTLPEFIEKSGTTALLIFQNDSLVWERYYLNRSEEEITQLFSVTKSYVGLMAAILIDLGLLNPSESVDAILPDYANLMGKGLTVEHLLNMHASLDMNDGMDLLKLARLYYEEDVADFLKSLGLGASPGSGFSYQSAATMLLGMVVEKKTGSRMAELLEQHLWQPAGMENKAWLCTDDRGNAKNYGGLAAHPRDLIRLGQLLLNGGLAGDNQIVSEQWINQLSEKGNNAPFWWGYRHQWWRNTWPDKPLFDQKNFMALGMKGQVLYIDPENRLVMVRLGNHEKKVRWGWTLSRLGSLIANSGQKESVEPFRPLVGNYRSEGLESNEFRILKVKEHKEKALVLWAGHKYNLRRDSPFSFSNSAKNIQLFQASGQDGPNRVVFDFKRKSYDLRVQSEIAP